MNIKATQKSINVNKMIFKLDKICVKVKIPKKEVIS